MHTASPHLPWHISCGLCVCMCVVCMQIVMAPTVTDWFIHSFQRGYHILDVVIQHIWFYSRALAPMIHTNTQTHTYIDYQCLDAHLEWCCDYVFYGFWYSISFEWTPVCYNSKTGRIQIQIPIPWLRPGLIVHSLKFAYTNDSMEREEASLFGQRVPRTTIAYSTTRIYAFWLSSEC